MKAPTPTAGPRRSLVAAATGAATALALLTPQPTAAGQEAAAAPSASAARGALQARPDTVDFKSKRVGTENYKRTRITNTAGTDLVVLVTGGLPDDFGFGLMPGQTCPVFSPGEVLGAGASCYAVVRFSPTQGFIGWHAVGELIATAADPTTSTVVDTLSIPVLGTAVP